MVNLYDKNGNMKRMDSVDAREHIATGRWFSSPPVEQAETKRGRPRKQNDGDILAESDSLSEK